MIGPKLRDGLLAYVEMERLRSQDVFPFVDAILVEMGYPPKVADAIILRLARRGWIEWGVSMRTGWLTDKGRAIWAEEAA